MDLYSKYALNGNYIIILPPDQNYIMMISADGYGDIEEDLFYQGGTNVKERVQHYKMKVSLEQ